MLGFDRRGARRRAWRSLVRASGADLGAVLDPSGEQLTLVDDRGVGARASTSCCWSFLDLVCDRLLGDRIALPITVSRVAAEIVRSRGYEVLWTKTSAAALMEEADAPGVGFAANIEGGVILPGFLPAFDAAAGLLKMLDLLATARHVAVRGASASVPAGAHGARGGRSPRGSRRGPSCARWSSRPRVATST